MVGVNLEKDSGSLGLDFREYQPAIIPATNACGVSDDLPLGSV